MSQPIPSGKRFGGKREKLGHKKEKSPDKDKPKLKFGARFVRHVTVDDNTEMAPGTPFLKIWRFRNETVFNWPENTHLLCVGKDNLSGPDYALVPKHAAPGEEVDVSVSLIAPMKPGRYTAYYRLAASPDGKKFGQRVRCQIQVSGGTGTPMMIPPASPGSSSSSDDDKQGAYETWGQKLVQLDNMGFRDKKKNIKLLKKFGGDLDKVVAKLIKKQQKKLKQGKM